MNVQCGTDCEAYSDGSCVGYLPAASKGVQLSVEGWSYWSYLKVTYCSWVPPPSP